MIVIPLTQQNSYEEIRYCLRAIDKFHEEQQVMIVGNTLPEWVKNITHLLHNDYPHFEFKARSIYEKILSAFDYMDEMLFFNDDHIILAKVDYLHHKGKMDPNDRHKNGSYTALLRNTSAQFPGCMDYDTHCPIWYEKEKFKNLAQLNWNKPHGYGIKTSYCSLNNLTGTYYPDLKFRQTIGDIEGRLYFSTDNCTNLTPLKDLFPVKSKFER
jgi:hypothetical protein